MRKSRTAHHIMGRANGAAKLVNPAPVAAHAEAASGSAAGPSAQSSLTEKSASRPAGNPDEKKREAVAFSALPTLSREEAVRRATEKIINATPNIVDAVMQQAGGGNYQQAKFLFDFVGLAGSPQAPASTAEQSLAAVLLRALDLGAVDLDQGRTEAEPAAAAAGNGLAAGASDNAAPESSAPSAAPGPAPAP